MSWSCPRCRSRLVLHEVTLSCGHCQQSYPVLGGHIPVLLPNFEDHIEQTVSALKTERMARINQLLLLKKALKTAPDYRLDQLQKLHDAYAHNNQLLSACLHSFSTIQPLKPLSTPKFKAQATLWYHRFETCLNYLRLDWGGEDQYEEEVAAVDKRIASLVDRYCAHPQSALITGAGLGRYAHELAHQFEQTYAVDHSMMMGGLYHSIQQREAKHDQTPA